MNPWRQSSAMVGRFFCRPAALLFILLTVGLAWPRPALADGTWSETGPLATARRTHTATLLADGKVLVAGGEGPGGYLASAELFNPADGTWSTTGPLATVRYAHTATLLPNGKVLAAGGYNGGPGQCRAFRSGHRHLEQPRPPQHRPPLSHSHPAG